MTNKWQSLTQMIKGFQYSNSVKRLLLNWVTHHYLQWTVIIKGIHLTTYCKCKLVKMKAQSKSWLVKLESV